MEDIKYHNTGTLNLTPTGGATLGPSIQESTLKYWRFGMANFFVLSFYTRGTRYEDYAMSLEEDCCNWDIECVLVPIDNTGSWVSNCAMKPRVILDAMLEQPEKRWLYLDADAGIVDNPALIDEITEDFGAYWLGTELLSGTLFFNNTQPALDLVKAWVVEQYKHPYMWDQICLAKLLDLRLSSRVLPASYCKIFDNAKHFGVVPVIQHAQASRTAKQEILNHCSAHSLQGEVDLLLSELAEVQGKCQHRWHDKVCTICLKTLVE